MHRTVAVDCSVEMDHGQTALEIMTSCAANSWCNMMAHGATATMEVRRGQQAWERAPGWDLFRPEPGEPEDLRVVQSRTLRLPVAGR